MSFATSASPTPSNFDSLETLSKRHTPDVRRAGSCAAKASKYLSGTVCIRLVRPPAINTLSPVLFQFTTVITLPLGHPHWIQSRNRHCEVWDQHHRLFS